MAYMVYGAGGKKRGEIYAATEPFSLVEIEATHAVGRDIQTLNSVSMKYVPKQTLTDFRRRAVSVFLAETVYRTMRHPEPDEVLFDFFASAVRGLDEASDPENFHLRFLLHYTRFLGIMPSIDEAGKMLDIATGLLVSPADMDNCFSVDETAMLMRLQGDEPLRFERAMRQSLLEKICLYYECHLTDFVSPKSIDVLRDVFD